MKGFIMPRFNAANLTLFFRACSLEWMRRSADRSASMLRGLDPDGALRDRIRKADETSSFWILHAR